MVSASIALPVAALAQSDGSVNVTVRDTAGFPLAKARVTILGANGSHTMITGQDGRATFPETPGIYTVSVTATGFEAGRNDGIAVAPGQSADVSFTLANVTLQTIGTVRRTSTSVNATSSANSTVSGSTFLDQGQKQIVNVLDQVPGVEINRDSSNAPGANSSISIRGAQPYESQILIDGHPVVSSANGSAGFNGTFINSLLLGDVEINKGPGNLPNTIESAVGGSLNFKTPNITSTASGDAATSSARNSRIRSAKSAYSSVLAQTKRRAIFRRIRSCTVARSIRKSRQERRTNRASAWWISATMPRRRSIASRSL
jgi:hypothetical protein